MRHHQRALDIAVEHGNRCVQMEVLNAYGENLGAAGRTGQARATHHTAVALAEELGDHREQARALVGVAETLEADGDTEQAAVRRQEAARLYAKLGISEPGRVGG